MTLISSALAAAVAISKMTAATAATALDRCALVIMDGFLALGDSRSAAFQGCPAAVGQAYGPALREAAGRFRNALLV